MNHSPGWFSLNRARAAAVIAYCNEPTPANLAALEALTAERQPDLFTTANAHVAAQENTAYA